MPALNETAASIGEFILDLLQECSIDETGAVLDYVIRHHAINAELIGGDDAALCWLEQVRRAVEAAEGKLGDYIERERLGDAAVDAILGRDRMRRAA